MEIVASREKESYVQAEAVGVVKRNAIVLTLRGAFAEQLLRVGSPLIVNSRRDVEGS